MRLKLSTVGIYTVLLPQNTVENDHNFKKKKKQLRISSEKGQGISKTNATYSFKFLTMTLSIYKVTFHKRLSNLYKPQEGIMKICIFFFKKPKGK